ncbi:MFS transporter [Streptacidiphilus sp. 4-A2]|nr:MFS transporter [Streptacidiphilus sp. 4-A2]
MVGLLYPDQDDYSRSMAVWGTLAALGATSGTVLSGVLSAAVSWRWEFAVPVLLSLAGLVWAGRLLPASQPAAKRTLDVPGSVLITGGLTALTYGLAGVGTASGAVVWGPIAAGCLLLAAFVVVELRTANPLVPLTFLVEPKRGLALWVVMLGSAGMSSIFYFLSLYLQQVRGASPLLTSAAFIPFSCAQLTAGSQAGKAIRRFGARTVLACGLLLSGAGLLLISRLGQHSSYAGPILIGLLLFPIGIVGSSPGRRSPRQRGCRTTRRGWPEGC